METMQFNSPQIVKIHQGKVRDSFRIDPKLRMIITTDRLSCFDEVLETTLPSKGKMLNEIAEFWFEKTMDIIPNHLVKVIHPTVALVREAEAIKVEMIVRQFLTGSLWRKYQKGERCFCGITLPEGMKKNDRFPTPIVTPTTKESTDRNISPEEIVSSKLTTKEIYTEMEEKSRQLFLRGQAICQEKGLVLVDTKYEFGLIDGTLCLIDEIHTPDSSRFWLLEEYTNDPETASHYDKEFIRLWLLDHPTLRKLPADIVQAGVERYKTVYQKLLSKTLFHHPFDPQSIKQALVEYKLMKEGYVAILLGSKGDLEHALKIKNALKDYPVWVELRIVSAHKNGEDIIPIAKRYNNAAEPGVAIAIAGRSNGLGGALSANLTIPVISCPPFKDQVDLRINIFSSLMMPSETPAMVCIDPTNTAQAALRCLNIPSMKQLIKNRIADVKKTLQQDDLEILAQVV